MRRGSVARRAGQNFTFAQLNYFFLINEMFVPGSTYWNVGMAGAGGARDAHQAEAADNHGGGGPGHLPGGTAQLIQTRDGFHLWSNAYDRAMGNVFVIQDDIASNVATALKVVLDEDSWQRMQDAGVRNVDAFIEFQKSRESGLAWPLETLIRFPAKDW